jgi:response regulator of citrate/malate metabolism
MNWENLVPPYVATQQRAWELQRQIVGMRGVGFTLKSIAERAGISTHRVRQYLSYRVQRESPVEHWMRAGGEIAEMASGRPHYSYR